MGSSIIGALFTLMGLVGIFLQTYLGGVIWLAVGTLMAVLGTADQQALLPRWRVILALAFPLVLSRCELQATVGHINGTAEAAEPKRHTVRAQSNLIERAPT
jgi:hypothetical protein